MLNLEGLSTGGRDDPYFKLTGVLEPVEVGEGDPGDRVRVSASQCVFSVELGMPGFVCWAFVMFFFMLVMALVVSFVMAFIMFVVLIVIFVTLKFGAGLDHTALGGSWKYKQVHWTG